MHGYGILARRIADDEVADVLAWYEEHAPGEDSTDPDQWPMYPGSYHVSASAAFEIVAMQLMDPAEHQEMLAKHLSATEMDELAHADHGWQRLAHAMRVLGPEYLAKRDAWKLCDR